MLREALTINLGSTARPIKKVSIPIKNVEAYEIKVVMKSPFPDLFPKDAIPGTINPTIISGIKKLSKFPNMLLKVINILIGISKLI